MHFLSFSFYFFQIGRARTASLVVDNDRPIAKPRYGYNSFLFP